MPASLIEPPAMRPPLGSRCMIDSAVIVLPQPDSPTTPSVSPSATCKRHAVNGVHDAVPQLDLSAQVGDF